MNLQPHDWAQLANTLKSVRPDDAADLEETAEIKGCGANKPGGGGFAAGNTCARGGKIGKVITTSSSKNLPPLESSKGLEGRRLEALGEIISAVNEVGEKRGDFKVQLSYTKNDAGRISGAVSYVMRPNDRLSISHIGSMDAGQGTTLVNAVIQYGMDNKAKVISAYSAPNATGFWKKAGFVEKEGSTGVFERNL